MDGMRKAALMLSSLRDEDRAWLLAQVGETERSQLGSLLAEVGELGVSLDAQTVRQLVQTSAAPESDSAPRPLANASAQSVFEILAHEPDWLIAIVVQARPWKWREPFLVLLGTERRLRVRRARPAAKVKPRMLEVLIAAVEARLDEQAVPAWEPPEQARRAIGFTGGFPGAIGKKLWHGVTQWRR